MQIRPISRQFFRRSAVGAMIRGIPVVNGQYAGASLEATTEVQSRINEWLVPPPFPDFYVAHWQPALMFRPSGITARHAMRFWQETDQVPHNRDIWQVAADRDGGVWPLPFSAAGSSATPVRAMAPGGSRIARSAQSFADLAFLWLTSQSPANASATPASGGCVYARRYLGRFLPKTPAAPQAPLFLRSARWRSVHRPRSGACRCDASWFRQGFLPTQ